MNENKSLKEIELLKNYLIQNNHLLSTSNELNSQFEKTGIEKNPITCLSIHNYMKSLHDLSK